jgi:hypothetical protein
MASGAVYCVKPRSRGSETATWVVLEQYIPDHLRDVVYHLPVADTVDNLALLELRTEAVQGVQFTLVYPGTGNVTA